MFLLTCLARTEKRNSNNSRLKPLKAVFQSLCRRPHPRCNVDQDQAPSHPVKHHPGTSREPDDTRSHPSVLAEELLARSSSVAVGITVQNQATWNDLLRLPTTRLDAGTRGTLNIPRARQQSWSVVASTARGKELTVIVPMVLHRLRIIMMNTVTGIGRADPRRIPRDTIITSGVMMLQTTAMAITIGLLPPLPWHLTPWFNNHVWKRRPFSERSFLGSTILRYVLLFELFFVFVRLSFSRILFSFLIFQLERFLIANRDEYLKHSSMNYTAEQKQYNNWLTERLLEVAGQHNYVFDPEDFNFVAIRDRIRCYYKSYVQTARKRGLKLPEKKE
jgi:hypothetical protein